MFVIRGAAGERPPRVGIGLSLAITALVTTVIAVALLVTGPRILVASGLRTAGGGQSTIPASVFSPTPEPTPSGTAAHPLGAPPALTPTNPIQPATLSARLRSLPREQGGTNATLVIDPATGQVLVSENQTALLIPASNLKTLVSLSTLTALDPDHTFTTSTVLNPNGQLVLKGGGDPYLSLQPHPELPGGPTLTQLADQTVAALKAQGVTSLTLAVDDSLFSGPAWNPTWPAGYVDQVTPIGALMVDGGRQLDRNGAVVPGSGRAQDPGLDAAARFAVLLKQRGITVTGQTTRVAATGATLAEVKSLPLEVLVAQMMIHSDNTAAEIFLRHVGLAAGQPGSFAGGAAALQVSLTRLGLWQNGAIIHDGSGLSRDNRVSAVMLADAWRQIVNSERANGLLTSLPVAGVSGTLAGRYTDPTAAAAKGYVHGKTGTLTGVSSLSGWTLTRQGQPVVMVFMVNESTNDFFARTWIDRSSAVVAACGC